MGVVAESDSAFAAAVNTVEYAPGRRADVFGEAPASTALLWHGTQTDSRTAVRGVWPKRSPATESAWSRRTGIHTPPIVGARTC